MTCYKPKQAIVVEDIVSNEDLPDTFIEFISNFKLIYLGDYDFDTRIGNDSERLAEVYYFTLSFNYSRLLYCLHFLKESVPTKRLYAFLDKHLRSCTDADCFFKAFRRYFLHSFPNQKLYTSRVDKDDGNTFLRILKRYYFRFLPLLLDPVKFSSIREQIFEPARDRFSYNIPLREVVLPCGNCIGCKQKHSFDWAVRCVHEAQMHKDNCFITLTLNPLTCAQDKGSLNKKRLSNFIHALRCRYPEKTIRYFGCGEYGSLYMRPHYHLCLFGFKFPDLVPFKVIAGNQYYISEILQDLWPHGFVLISEVTFGSAAYVARYCMKKVPDCKLVTGDDGKPMIIDIERDPIPKNLVPEYVCMSLRPGIGYEWFEKYGVSDVYPHDRIVLEGGKKIAVPRYYDKLWKEKDPKVFEKTKADRLARLEDSQQVAPEEFSKERLYTKYQCDVLRKKKLHRVLESSLSDEESKNVTPCMFYL